jgi:hypothetical protein
MWDSTT